MPDIKGGRELRRDRREQKRVRRQLGEGGEFSQAWRLLAPWALLAMSLGVAPLAWYVARWREVQGFTAGCLLVAGVILVWSSLYLNRGRLSFNKVHEVFNFAAPIGVLSYTILFGISQYVMIGALVSGVTSAIIWHKRHTSTTLRELERTARGGPSKLSAEWREFTAEHMPSIAESQLTVFKDTEDEFAAGLDLGDGEVPSEITSGMIDKITRFAGGIRGGTTLSVGDALDKVGVHVMRTDPLKKSLPWQGPQAPGESIVEPITGLGVYRDRLDLSMVLPHVASKTVDGDDKQQSHMMFIGMSRAGKGDAGEILDVNVATRRDAAIVLCDAVKADQQLGVIGDAAVYVLPTAPAIRSFFWKLVNVTIPQRAAYLGDPRKNLLGKHLREWVPGCGLTWLLIHAYEAAALHNNPDMTKITERAASVGIQLLLEAQKGHHDKVDTNLRSNAADLVMFGCNDPDDAVLVMPRELVDMGAQPWVWRNRQPGMCYTVLSHLPESRQVVPARWARRAKDGSDVAAALAEYGHLAQPLDPVTAASWGEPYGKFLAGRQAVQERATRIHAFSGPPAPAYAAAAPVVEPRGGVLLAERPATAPVEREPADEGFDLDDDPDDEARDGAEQQQEVDRAAEDVIYDMAHALEGHRDAGDVLRQAVDSLEETDSDEPQGGPLGERFDDIDFPDDPDEAHHRPITSRDEAIDIVLDILADRIGEGREFRPGDLYDEIERRARKSDSWVRHLLPVLREWGCVREGDRYGVYEVIHTRRGDLEPIGQYRE